MFSLKQCQACLSWLQVGDEVLNWAKVVVLYIWAAFFIEKKIIIEK